MAAYAGVFDRTGVRTTLRPTDAGLEMKVEDTGPLAALQPDQPPMRLIAVDDSLFLAQNPVVEFYQPVWFSGFLGGQPEYVFQSRVSRRV